MFRNSFGDRCSRLVNKRYCYSITGINLCGRIKYTHGQWCNLLSMEYWADDGKHHGKSEFNNNLFCYRNKLQRMFRYCFSNCFCWFLYYSYCDCITGIDLFGRLFNANRQWRNILSMEHGPDDG